MCPRSPNPRSLSDILSLWEEPGVTCGNSWEVISRRPARVLTRPSSHRTEVTRNPGLATKTPPSTFSLVQRAFSTVMPRLCKLNGSHVTRAQVVLTIFGETSSVAECTWSAWVTYCQIGLVEMSGFLQRVESGGSSVSNTVTLMKPDDQCMTDGSPPAGTWHHS